MSRTNNNSDSKKEVEKIGSVTIANDAGNKPIKVDCYPEDTVATILERAQLVLEEDTTVSRGRARIDNMDARVSPGDTLVIAGKVSNGNK